MTGKHRKYKRLILQICFWMIFVLGNVFYVRAEGQAGAGSDAYETWLQTVYSRAEGLSVGTANAIATTSDGIIWVGTYAGLYRYNGSKFQLMNQFNTVKSVECLYVDDEDRIWVGTNDNGISVFQDEMLIGRMTEKEGLPSDAVRSIVRGTDGNYYIGTSDGMAVVRYDKDPELVKTIDEITYADKSTADQKGNVAAISSYGPIYLLNDGEIIAQTQMPDEDQFTSCVFDVSGYVYVGTFLGYVYVYEVSDRGFREISQLECPGIRKVNNLIRVNEDTIFVCADNGIGYFDQNQEFHKLETPDFNSNIYDVIADYQGNLWFVSSRKGLLRLCKTSFVELFTEFSIDSAVVNSVERYEGLLYVGTDIGLVIIDEEKQQKIDNELTKELENVRIRQILKDRKENLWFCTYGEGLVEYDGKDIRKVDKNRHDIGNRVRTILERDNGELVVSSENGIAFLRDGKVAKILTARDGMPNQVNLCLLEKDDGTLLIGSDGSGIVQVQVDQEYQIQVIGTEQGLPSGVILRMENDEQGDGIFVVTSNSLCYIYADGTIATLNNFPYSNNYSIIQQDDTVFVLGSSGIFALRREELLANREKMKFTFLDSRAGLHDALVANSWCLHEEKEKKVYLATNAGATLFDLAAYDERPSDFYIRISSITIDGEDSAMDQESFAFPKKVRRLEIQPEIINYSTVDPIISCWLEGFDKEPIVMPQSELTTIVYTNLPAGKYTFNMELVDAESGVSISKKVYYLEKESTFTDTIWFYALVVMLVILAASWIGMIVANRTYTLKITEKEKELEKTWKISVTDELTGLRNRFAMRMEFPRYLGKDLTVTMMDIDYFKQFNDQYGHEMGDRVLREVSAVIAGAYKSPNLAYRFGGDEFLLWDVSKDQDAVEQKLKKLKDTIARIHMENCDEVIRVSFGCVSGVPNSEEELRELTNQADKKLYEVKKNRSMM